MKDMRSIWQVGIVILIVVAAGCDSRGDVVNAVDLGPALWVSGELDVDAEIERYLAVKKGEGRSSIGGIDFGAEYESRLGRGWWRLEFEKRQVSDDEMAQAVASAFKRLVAKSDRKLVWTSYSKPAWKDDLMLEGRYRGERVMGLVTVSRNKLAGSHVCEIEVVEMSIAE